MERKPETALAFQDLINAIAKFPSFLVCYVGQGAKVIVLATGEQEVGGEGAGLAPDCGERKANVLAFWGWGEVGLAQDRIPRKGLQLESVPKLSSPHLYL